MVGERVTMRKHWIKAIFVEGGKREMSAFCSEPQSREMRRNGDDGIVDRDGVRKGER